VKTSTDKWLLIEISKLKWSVLIVSIKVIFSHYNYLGLDTTVVNAKDYNFDHPNALDFDLAYETLKLMK
jgi:hypothetical protein